MGSMIARLRKEKGMTQEQLANELGITYQAVSKWENGLSSPDISALPLLADLFGVPIDRFFGREGGNEPAPAEAESKAEELEEKNEEGGELPESPLGRVEDLPWEDDGTLHAVLFRGHEMIDLRSCSAPEKLRLKEMAKLVFRGVVAGVQSEFALEIHGEVRGDVIARDDVSCEGVGGSVKAAGDVSCGAVTGSVTAQGDVDCETVGGDVKAGGDVNCGAVTGGVTAQGDVNCDDVKGDVTANGDVSCDAVAGNVHAEGDVSCEDVKGDVTATGEVECGAVGGDVKAGGDVSCDDVKGDVMAIGDVDRD